MNEELDKEFFRFWDELQVKSLDYYGPEVMLVARKAFYAGSKIDQKPKNDFYTRYNIEPLRHRLNNSDDKDETC